MQLKLGLFLAVVAAMPVILRQAARFVAPALYEHERRAAGRAVAAATLLFLAGAAVGLFLVVPLMMKFSAAYASESLAPVIGIGSFVNLVGLLALSFGVMFQLPVVMVLLVRCGVVEVGTLKRSRPLAVTVIFILAALLTPPDVVSQLLLGVPTLAAVRGGAAHRRPVQSAESAAGRTAACPLCRAGENGCGGGGREPRKRCGNCVGCRLP